MELIRAPRRAWLILGVAVVAYAAAVFQRASLGVAAVEAQRRFGTTAAVLSLFSVLQIIVYAALQIPVGAVLDRIGPRRMIAGGALIMSVGQLLLATAHSVGLAIAARAILGAGDAMTFISVLRLVVRWFPPRQVAVVTQLTALMGQLGQIAAAYPLVVLLQGSGWSVSFLIASGVALLAAAGSASWIRDAPADSPVAVVPTGAGEIRGHLAAAWREPGTRLGFWTHLTSGFSGTVFVLLWGYPFLVVGEHRSPAEAGLLLTLLSVITVFVAPTVGRLTARWPLRRSVQSLTIIGATIVVWTVVLAWPGRAPLALLVALVVVLSANGPGAIMGFDYARTENEPERIGAAYGIVNVGGFLAAIGTIVLVGIVLSLRSAGGPHSYTLDDFRLAFAVQYPFWAIGLTGLLRTRRRARAARGLELEPFHRAVVRHWRQRR